MTEIDHTPSAETQTILAALQAAVRKTLERKQRLGQYAVVWQDGKPARIESDEAPIGEVESVSRRSA